VVTSIDGNNVTWRDSKTGNLITDVHQDLELANNRRSNMPYHNGRNGSNGRQQRNTRRRVANNRNNMTACLQGQHWMPAVNGKPGFCMNDSDMPATRRNSRTRRRTPSVRRGRPATRTMRRGGRPTARRRQTGGQTPSRYYMNGVPYNGLVLDVNGIPYSTKSGVMEGTSVPLTIGKP
jgi:hypothetical protein